MRLLLRVLATLALAFVLTSAVMFWLPVLKHVGSGGGFDVTDTSWEPGDCCSYGRSNTAEALKKLSPIEERQTLEDISNELRQKSSTELFKMKAYDDVCGSALIACRGLTSTKVKPFIDAVLSDRQATEAALNARMGIFIAAGSLFVSFVALLFTGLTYRGSRASVTGSS